MGKLGISLGFFSLLLLCTADSSGGDKKTGTPKDSIAAQLELLKAGKTDELRNWFTERQRLKITPDAVAKGKKNASIYSIDELVGNVEFGKDLGRETAKIKMKNGRTLTTLVLIEGKWLADTIWFK